MHPPFTLSHTGQRLAHLVLVFATALLLITAPTAAPARGESPSSAAAIVPFYAVQRERVDLPEGVMPWGPTWSPDGRHIVFQDYHGGGEWTADADGGNAHCLTCGWDDHPKMLPGFVYAFADNQRLMVANELGSSVYVLECAPTLYDCATHEWLPVDFSADKAVHRVILDVAPLGVTGRRTFHLAPDDVHLGYTLVRTDGLLMTVGRLERRESRYALEDPRVVNPHGPASTLGTDTERWAYSGSLYELKSFVDGGRKILALGEMYGTPEQIEIDLTTGATRRLVTFPDWNEDGATSPDGGLLLAASWRTQNRLMPLSVLPTPARPSAMAQAFQGPGLYYISSRPGFACDLQPWLLPPGGDEGGELVGQPLNPYMGGSEIGANNLSGQQVWSPDSTKVLLQARTLEPVPDDAGPYLRHKGPAPSSLLIAHIARPATAARPPVTTKIGSWAPTPQRYTSAYDRPGIHRTLGSHSGSAVFTNLGNVAGGRFSATYRRYSDDGIYFINGTVTRTGSAMLRDTVTADLTVTDERGTKVGAMKARLTFTAVIPPPPTGEAPSTTKSGSVTTTWKGKTYEGLTDVGPCTNSLPRPSKLTANSSATWEMGWSTITTRVTSNIHGDVRPVQGAIVTLNGEQGVTDATGEAMIRVRVTSGSPTLGTVRISAGDTFAETTTSVRLR